jgi:PST family polysaccharide transporter
MPESDRSNNGAAHGGASLSGLGQRVVSATAWSAFCVWANRALTFAFFVVLARLLQPEVFGLVALSMVYVGFLTILQEQGLAQAIIQRKDLHPDHLNTAFWMNLGFSLILVLGTQLSAPLVGWLFGEPRLTGVVRGLSFLLLISALTCVQRALLHRKLEFRVLALAGIVGVSVGGVVGTVAALNDFGVWSLVLHQVTMRACESAIIWRHSYWRPSLRWRRAHFRDLFSFGKYVVASQFASFGHVYAADMIIGLYLGPTAVGLFDVSYRCVRMVLQMISGVVTRVSYAAFAQLQSEPERGQAAFLRLTRHVALFSFPVFVGMAVLAPDIVGGLFGKKWAAAIPAMRVLSFVGMLQSMYYLKRSLVLAYGKPRWHFWLELLAAGLTVIALLSAIRAGIVAAAWAHVLATALCYPFVFLAVRALVRVSLSEYVRNLVPALTGSTALAASVLFVKEITSGSMAPIWMLLVAVPTGMCVFFVTVWIVDPATVTRSRQHLQGLFGKVMCDKPDLQVQ